MSVTFLVAGSTTADAHDSSCSVPAPAATGFLSDALAVANVFSTFLHSDVVECAVKGEDVRPEMNRDWGNGNKPQSFAPCEDGMAAGTFPCDGVDMMSHLSMTELGIGLADVPAGVNDVWGWTDTGEKGKKQDYALLGADEGTVFVNITDPKRPVVLGMLPTANGEGQDGWRDIKVYEDHAYVVSENNNHGVQVFDLTRLRGLDGDKDRRFDMDAHYTEMGSAHNIAINEDTGFAYALGSGPFSSLGLPLSITIDGESFLATEANFGEPFSQDGLRGVEYVDTGSTGCLAVDDGYDADEDLGDVLGKIAIIDRGGCEFSSKVLNAQNGGALATIVINTVPEGDPSGRGGYITMAPGAVADQVTIPSAFLSLEVGTEFRSNLPGSGDVFANDPPAKCGDGLHMIDISSPKNPTFAGCESETGYVHDTQCVVYEGPDADYQGREICFNSNGIALSFDPAANWYSIVDVTDKANPVVLSRVQYEGSVYSHQGWLTEDQGYFLFGDEGDELYDGLRFGEETNTTTRVWDVSDLENPFVANKFENTTRAIDHNIYTEGNRAYASNYMAGLRVYDASSPGDGLSEVAFFDIFPESDEASFAGGSWSNYPYFKQKNIIAVSSVESGLFILRHDPED